ncbi:MAG: cation:proton antiporter [Bacteroidota bacterium]
MNLEIPLQFIFGAANNTPYYIVIAASAVIILSYFFNVISRKTNIPSVILLIAAGIGMHYGLDFFGLSTINNYIIDNDNILPILGQVGLILIVLEAALDLELSKKKWPVIWKSFSVALLALLGSTALVAFVLEFFIFNNNWNLAIVCAIPLSIMSSAIIIPSVANLIEVRKEFMVYESTFSDILGIMLFYPFLDGVTDPNFGGIGAEFGKVFLTIIVSVIISYFLVWLFQRIKSQVKLFLLIALLCLLYVIGKIYGLSTLVLILIFGLMLNNSELFFRGKLSKYINHDKLNHFLHDFHVLALESAFVLRTFFFVIFGITISLDYLLNYEVALIGICVAAALYIIRWIFLKIFISKQTSALLLIAPRGLITVLLFFSITGSPVILDMMSPSEEGSYLSPDVEKMNGVILYAIIITSVLMTWTLISNAKSNRGLLPENDGDEELEEGQIAEVEENSDEIQEQKQISGEREFEEDLKEDIKSQLKDDLTSDTDFDDPENDIE